MKIKILISMLMSMSLMVVASEQKKFAKNGSSRPPLAKRSVVRHQSRLVQQQTLPKPVLLLQPVLPQPELLPVPRQDQVTDGNPLTQVSDEQKNIVSNALTAVAANAAAQSQSQKEIEPRPLTDHHDDYAQMQHYGVELFFYYAQQLKKSMMEAIELNKLLSPDDQQLVSSILKLIIATEIENKARRESLVSASTSVK